jgi:hypothetical protein
LSETWTQHGRTALATVRQIDPASYIKIVAAVCRGIDERKTAEVNAMDLIERLLDRLPRR